MPVNGMESRMDVKSVEKRICVARAMIVEMIEDAMKKSIEKGPHALTQGCNCIVCVIKRKRMLQHPSRPWRYRL